MNVLITLTSAGVDTGPFNLYSNVDTYTTAFETNISRGILVAGYTSTIVPPGTTAIRVKSTGVCSNYVDITLTVPATTTTTTTAASTSTTTTTATPGTTTTTTTAAPVITTTTTTTPAPVPTTTTTTTYVGPATTTTTTTAPATTTTTTTLPSTTTTTTTSLSCFIYNGQNNNVDNATIFWTNCDGSPGSEVVAPSAFSSNFCAREGSVSGFNFTIDLIEPCSVPTTTTTTTSTPTTTTTSTTIITYYQYTLCTDFGVVYYTTTPSFGSQILIAGQCFSANGTTTTPTGTEFFAIDGSCSCS